MPDITVIDHFGGLENLEMTWPELETAANNFIVNTTVDHNLEPIFLGDLCIQYIHRR